MRDTKSIILKWLFITTAVASLLGYALLLITRYRDHKLFSDFAEVLTYCLVRNPYDGSSGIAAIYPPISYLIFFPFLLFCRQDISDLVAGEIDLTNIYTRPMFVVAYTTYFVITLALVLLVIAKMSHLKGKNLFYLLGAITLSGPIFYLFTRGNIILVPMLFTLIFFWLYQSDKRWHRELANVCLALAIAIKIYPVLIVLLLVKERRWLDITKIGCYAAALVFVPFVFVSGNIIANIKCIFSSYSGLANTRDRFFFSSVSINGVATTIAHFLSIYFGTGVNQALPIVVMILKYSLLLISGITLFLSYGSEKKLATVSVAIGCYILFQDISFGYVLIFTFILLVLFLNSLETYRQSEIIFYAVIFGVIMFTLPFCFKFCILQFFALVVLVIKSIIDLLSMRCKKQ